MKSLFLALFLLTFYLFAQVQSKHFAIQKLSDGVYAAIATNGGHAICNAGIIDLGDATLIFDPFMTPEAAKDLQKVSEQLTGHKVKYVIE
jgi:cyclase